MKRHRALLAVCAALAAPAGAEGQVADARWSLTVGLEGERFGHTATDTVAPAEAAARLRPSGRVGVRVGMQRAFGPWRAELALGWAQGDVEAANDAVAIRDRTADLTRYRLAAGVERALILVGRGELALGLGPTLDLWTVDDETRLRLGGECRLVLRVPLGAAALENRLRLGLSASPIEGADVGDGFETRALRAAAFGVGLRVPL